MKINLKGDSWIKLIQLPGDLINYFYLKKDLIESHKPKSNNNVLVYDKATHKHYEKQIFRKFKSYLNVPKFDPTVQKSYMFSGFDGKEIEEKLPDEFVRFFNWLKAKHDINYNQVVVNWYDSVQDYIEMHSDCTNKFIKKDAPIALMNFNLDFTTRSFIIEDKLTSETFSIELDHGLLIIMGGNFQEVYRHGVSQLNGSLIGGRVSLTFRQIAA